MAMSFHHKAIRAHAPPVAPLDPDRHTIKLPSLTALHLPPTSSPQVWSARPLAAAYCRLHSASMSTTRLGPCSCHHTAHTSGSFVHGKHTTPNHEAKMNVTNSCCSKRATNAWGQATIMPPAWLPTPPTLHGWGWMQQAGHRRRCSVHCSMTAQEPVWFCAGLLCMQLEEGIP